MRPLKQILMVLTVCLITVATGSFAKTYAQQKEITLFLRGGHWTEDIRDWFNNELIPEFHAANPDIKVHVQYAAGSDASLSVLKATGMMPDVFFGAISEGKRWGLPLNEFLADWNDLQDVPPPLLEAAQLDGLQMSIPWSLSLRHFFYRIDKFEQAGLDATAPPRTWDDLLSVIPHLTRYGSDGEMTQYSMVGSDVWLLETFYYQAGGTDYPVVPVDADWLEYDPALRVFEYMEDLYKTAYPQSNITRFRGARFDRGHAAIGFDSSRLIDTIFETLDNSLIGAFPAFSMTDDSRRVAVVNNNGLIISEDTQHPEAAWKLLATLASPENTARYNVHQVRIPPRVSAMTGAVPFDSPILQLSAPLINYSVQSFLTEFGAMGSTFNPVFNRELTAMFRGDQSPTAAVETIRTEIKARQAEAKGN